MSEPVEWLWFGEDESGGRHVSFGRWQRHACQHRYKYAAIQPTEHDHSANSRLSEPSEEEIAGVLFDHIFLDGDVHGPVIDRKSVCQAARAVLSLLKGEGK